MTDRQDNFYNQKNSEEKNTSSQNNGWNVNSASDAKNQNEPSWNANASADHLSQNTVWSSGQTNGQQWTGHSYQYYTAPHTSYPVPVMPKKRDPKKKYAGLLAGAMAVTVVLSGTMGFAGAYLGNQFANSSADGTKKVVYQSVERTSANSSSGQTEALSVADVAKLAADSVVEIRTESVTSGRFMQQYVSEGAGSGVIITSDGYIVTNHHVIDGASKITVRLKNGDTYDATLVGKDSKTDIAVLKINAKDLSAAVYGDSSKLVIGETAVAIGNPLGELGGTVTSGIISALDRSITIDGETMTLLQTNAEINPGNSGGGLFNAYGELIGIVNAKSSGSDIEGLGFAIPINTAKAVIEEIMENGYVSGRISLGLTVVDIPDTETAMAYRVSKTGVYVSAVNSQTSQFQAGDRILSFNGESIDDAESLTDAISRCKVGDTVSVVVERRGERLTFDLTLQEEKPE